MLNDTSWNGGGGGPLSRVAYLNVDYDEFKPATYRGITVNLPEGDYGPFPTLADAEHQATLKGATSICRLSSFDNFAMDGGILP